jgi:hypothetical protein
MEYILNPWLIHTIFVALEALSGRLWMFFELQKQRKCLWEFDQLRAIKCLVIGVINLIMLYQIKLNIETTKIVYCVEIQWMVHQYLIALLYYNGFPVVSFNPLISSQLWALIDTSFMVVLIFV